MNIMTFFMDKLVGRDMQKNLENMKGDFASDYKTIPVIYGEIASKRAITTLAILTIIPIYILIEIYDVGYMDIYFYTCLTTLILFLLKLWKSTTKEEFLLLHNVLKALIGAGVFCIVLIDPSVLWNGRNLILTVAIFWS